MHLARYSSRLDLPFIFSQLLDSRMIVSNRSQRHTCSLMDGQRERDRKKEDATRRREMEDLRVDVFELR